MSVYIGGKPMHDYVQEQKDKGGNVNEICNKNITININKSKKDE